MLKPIAGKGRTGWNANLPTNEMDGADGRAEGQMLIFPSLTFRPCSATCAPTASSHASSSLVESAVMNMLDWSRAVWFEKRKSNKIWIYFAFCDLCKVATGTFLISLILPDCPFMNPSKSLLFRAPWTLNPGIKINTGGNSSSLRRPFGPLIGIISSFPVRLYLFRTCPPVSYPAQSLALLSVNPGHQQALSYFHLIPPSLSCVISNLICGAVVISSWWLQRLPVSCLAAPPPQSTPVSLPFQPQTLTSAPPGRAD